VFFFFIATIRGEDVHSVARQKRKWLTLNRFCKLKLYEYKNSNDVEN